MPSVLKRIARRLSPNSSRQYLSEVNQLFAKSVRPGAMVLDAGAGRSPYRQLFSHAKYESADFEMVDKYYAPSTYVCDLAKIPVKDSRFDHILFNQVMEHLPNPDRVLTELQRILKPGGTMLCSCPLFYEEHEQPYDFYRYTQFAHHHLFENAGFEVIKIEWLEGYFGTVAYQFETMFRYLPWGFEYVRSKPLSLLLLIVCVPVKIMSAVFATVFYNLDRQVKVVDRGFPKNYVVLVRKPE